MPTPSSTTWESLNGFSQSLDKAPDGRWVSGMSLELKRERLHHSIIFLVCIALVFANAGPLRGETSAADRIGRIEGKQSPNRKGFDGMTVLEMMHYFHVPGLSIAVIYNSKVQWAKGYGIADVETGTPVSTTTLFQACSISKALTAMAFLKAVEDGKATLDEDINKLPRTWKIPDNSFNSASIPVTPRALLSHTSGTDDGFGFPGYDPTVPRPSPVQILEGSKPSNVGPVLFARSPFQGYKYSGGGLVIIQVALTDMMQMPFETVMQRSVLEPLGMTLSSYEQPLPESRCNETARAHDEHGASMGARWHVFPEQAAAGLWTTPTELAQFVIEIQKAIRSDSNEGKVLNSATAKEMVTPTGVGPFGLCLEIQNKGQGWYFSHSGSNWGFRCEFISHFGNGYGVVVMTNGDNGLPLIAEMEARVANAYNWNSLDKPIPR